MKIKDIEILKERDQAVKFQPRPLTKYQTQVLDVQLSTLDSTMWNLAGACKLTKETDPFKLADAVNRVIEHHPMMNIRIFMNAEGEFRQQVCPGLTRCAVKYVKEADIPNITKQYPAPFKMVNSPLALSCIYVTESFVYLVLDVHHIITDGSSMGLLMNEIAQYYHNPHTELEPDYYIGQMELTEEYKATDAYREDTEFFESEYGNTDWYVIPTPDFEITENKRSNLIVPMCISLEAIKATEMLCRTTRSRIANAAGLLALAKFSKHNDVMLSWIYSDRVGVGRSNMFGLLIKELPLGVHINELSTLGDLYSSINKQMKATVRHLDYQYAVEHGQDISSSFMEINYLSNINTDAMVKSSFGDSVVDYWELHAYEEAAEARFELDIIEYPEAAPEDQLQLTVNHMSSIYKKETVQHFANIYVEIFRRLCAAESTTPIIDLLK